jgi:hypothetical protein
MLDQRQCDLERTNRDLERTRQELEKLKLEIPSTYMPMYSHSAPVTVNTSWQAQGDVYLAWDKGGYAQSISPPVANFHFQGPGYSI